MSATVLLNGKLHRDPEQKTSGKGTTYATATVRDGQGDDAVWWRVLAFHTEARDELMTLRSGDGIAVSGTLKAEVYTGGTEPRVSLSVMADRLISAKRQKRERAAETRDARGTDGVDGRGHPFDDAVPF